MCVVWYVSICSECVLRERYIRSYTTIDTGESLSAWSSEAFIAWPSGVKE